MPTPPSFVADGAPSSSPRRNPGPGRPPGPPFSEAQRALIERWVRGKGGAPAQETPIPRRIQRGPAPLSFAQERIWFFAQYDRESPLYNLPLVLRVTGRLNLEAMRKALDAIVERHEILRTRFIAEEGRPVQVVDPPAPVPIVQVDLTTLRGSDLEAAVRQNVAAECRKPFDLARDPMLRVRLIRLNEGEHVLALVKHHIAADGWSERIFLSEWVRFYDGFDAGRPVALPELPIQYADYAAWQKDSVDERALEGQLAYWRETLAGAPPLLELPTNRPRPARQSFRGGTERRRLPTALIDSLQSLGRREETTLFVTLLAAFNVFLHRACRCADIVVGTPVAGRTRMETEELMGFFVNTLALRSEVKDDPPFVRFLRDVRETSLDALSHQELPFEKLVGALQPARSSSHLPVVQILFIFQGSPARIRQPSEIRLAPMDADTGTSKFDLTLYINEIEGEWVAAFEFNADLFTPPAAARMLENFQNLLESIAADPTLKLSELPLLNAAERGRILTDWNNTDLPYAGDRSLAEVFDAQATLSPHSPAAIFGSRTLTYRELARRSDRIAEELRIRGVGPGSLVAICLERSLAMVMALLGILKAGGAYLPLDPTFPRERLAFMLEDSGAPLLMTERALGDRLPPYPDAAKLWIDEDGRLTGNGRAAGTRAPPAEPPYAPDDLAYVLYTSGSTGTPKGVMVSRRNVLNFFAAMDRLLGRDGGTWLAITSICFDISVLELLWTLSRGFKLVVLSDGGKRLAREPGGNYPLLDQLRRHRVTHLQCTPSFARLLTELPEAQGAMLSIRKLLVGGEALPAELALKLARMIRGELLNMYGPTETTVWSSSHGPIIDPPDGIVPIGRPLANTRIHILDPHLEPMPVGMPGEIYIGGDGVALGYLRRPKLTEERFIGDPFRRGGRLYRTGDLGRYRPDGVIDYLGRTDHQVKLRGHRIELGELEAALRQHPAVRDCVAVVRKDAPGDERLVAYVVAARPGPAEGDPEWRRYLERKLPPYLVPASVVSLPKLPLTPNGKVDRNALPAPDAETARLERALPRNETEARLAGIWQSVLGATRIGITENFFDCGGHSLLAVRLAAQIGKAFAIELPISAIYDAPSVARLAELLEHGRRPGTPDGELVEIQPRGSKPPLFLIHGIGGGMMWGYANLARHLGSDQPVYAFRARGLDGSEEFTSIEKMAAHYILALRRFRPKGPYLLGGYCFGGNVAFEMACQLRAQGHDVTLTALFNAFPANSSFVRMRWDPATIVRFVRNLAVTASQFLHGDEGNRREFVLWKLRRLAQLVAGLARRRLGAPSDPDQYVDVHTFPEEQRPVLAAHALALEGHRSSHYPAGVTLFRTRGFPLFCSFEPDFGWGEFVRGRVDVRIIPGKHDNIMKEPHVRELARAVADCARLSGC